MEQAPGMPAASIVRVVDVPLATCRKRVFAAITACQYDIPGRDTPLDNSRYNDYCRRYGRGGCPRTQTEALIHVARQEVFLALRIAAARIVEPWEKFLKTTAELTLNQYKRVAHSARQPPGQAAVRRHRRPDDRARPRHHASGRSPEPARPGDARPQPPGPPSRRGGHL